MVKPNICNLNMTKMTLKKYEVKHSEPPPTGFHNPQGIMAMGVDEGMLKEVMGKVMLEQMEAKERQIDQEMRKLDELDDDDIERLREKRKKELKKLAQKKQEWKGQGHGRCVGHRDVGALSC